MLYNVGEHKVQKGERPTVSGEAQGTRWWVGVFLLPQEIVTTDVITMDAVNLFVRDLLRMFLNFTENKYRNLYDF